MEKYFILYEEAIALKELGFDEPCLGFFAKDKLLLRDSFHLCGKTHLAILYQQAFRWFREKGIDFSIMEKYKDLGKFYGGYIKIDRDSVAKSFGSNFRTYEEAELACLRKLIEYERKLNRI